MRSPRADWIAPAGLRVVEPDSDDAAIPAEVRGSRSLSLIAKGIYELVLAYQGRPVDPYEEAVEDPRDIAAGIEELIEAGLIMLLTR